MKRADIIKRVKETAKQLTAEPPEVFTSGAIYPKCALYTADSDNRPAKRITPDMRPTELLAYVSGMAQVINNQSI